MESLKKIINSIKPSSASQASERAFVGCALENITKNLSCGKPVLAGSFAKGTFLEGDKDIDIFVLFNHNVEKEAMFGIIKAAAENAFPKAKIIQAYAQHPYLRIFSEGRKIDLVPAYEVGHGLHFELKTAVDRSQLHTKYVLANMSEPQKDAVRLLKKFLKINNLYGAEIKVQGFSGYLCELMILKYGSFMDTLKAVSQWKSRAFFDVGDLTTETDSLLKFDGLLVTIDPVDKDRNVSAVVSKKNYFAFISLCRKFLDAKDKIAFFQERKFTSMQMKKVCLKRHIYCLSFKCDNAVDDIIWGQIRRFWSSTRDILDKEGFGIIGYAMEKCGGCVCIVFESANSSVQKNKIVLGPPVEFAADLQKFRSKYNETFILDNRIAAKSERVHTTIEGMLAGIRKITQPTHLRTNKTKLYKCGESIDKCRCALEKYIASRLIF